MSDRRQRVLPTPKWRAYSRAPEVLPTRIGHATCEDNKSIAEPRNCHNLASVISTVHHSSDTIVRPKVCYGPRRTARNFQARFAHLESGRIKAALSDTRRMDGTSTTRTTADLPSSARFDTASGQPRITLRCPPHAKRRASLSNGRSADRTVTGPTTRQLFTGD